MPLLIMLYLHISEEEIAAGVVRASAVDDRSDN
jgi:hypothetical protein